MKFTFIVDGPPVPCARPRFTGRRTFMPTSTRAYQTRVGWLALEKRPAKWRLDWGSYRVRVELYRARNAGDADNYLKSILDGVTDVLFEDDDAVHEATAVMHVDARAPRAVVEIEMVGDETRDERRKRMRRERNAERREEGRRR